MLHDGNDITCGGTAVPIALVRVGKMVTAKKDTYKRVYNQDGSYTYPKLEQNLLRHEGTEYFQSCELTGSSEGTDKKPKVSLLKAYQDVIVPALEEKIIKKKQRSITASIEKDVRRKESPEEKIIEKKECTGLRYSNCTRRKISTTFLHAGFFGFDFFFRHFLAIVRQVLRMEVARDRGGPRQRTGPRLY